MESLTARNRTALALPYRLRPYSGAASLGTANRLVTLSGKNCGLTLCAVLIVLSNIGQATARDQEYIDEINAEARSMEEVANTNITSSAKRNSRQEPTTKQASSKPNPAASHTKPDVPQYVEQLEKEIRNISPPTPANAGVTQQAPPMESSNKSDLTAEQKKLSAITEAQRKDMESALRNKIPGVYHLYNKLGLTQKRLVVKEYLSTHRISTASKTILQLYSGK